MTPARTRTVDSDRERERVVEEYARDGYRVVTQGETTTTLRRRDHGSLWAHLAVFLIIGWWTFGLGNLLYAIYRRLATKEGVVVRVADDAEVDDD